MEGGGIVADTYIFILCIGLSAIGAAVIYFCTRDDDPADKIAQERQEILLRLSKLHHDREFSEEVFVGHEVSIRRKAEIDEEKSKLMARLKEIEKEMGLSFDDDLW